MSVGLVARLGLLEGLNDIWPPENHTVSNQSTDGKVLHQIGPCV